MSNYRERIGQAMRHQVIVGGPDHAIMRNRPKRSQCLVRDDKHVAGPGRLAETLELPRDEFVPHVGLENNGEPGSQIDPRPGC